MLSPGTGGADGGGAGRGDRVRLLAPARRLHGTYLTESVHKVVFKKSIPSQFRQLILHISTNPSTYSSSLLISTIS